MEAEGVMLPVIDARCEYRQAARYDDQLDVVTRGALLSPARLQFDYEVARHADGVVTAVGRTLHAALSLAGKPCRLPERVRAVLA